MTIGAPDISVVQIRSQLDRILASASFRDSPALQRLLTYLVNEALEDRAGSLKEYSIGASVFQRGADFDPRTDSIVRVQMAAVRKKLTAYYAGTGALDELIVEIPRGHYAPVVSVRPPAPPQTTTPERANATVRWRLLTGAGAVLVVLAVGFAVYYLSLGRAAQTTAVKTAQWADHPVWRGFFEPGESTRLVVGVPFMYSFGSTLVRDPVINNTDDMRASSTVRTFADVMKIPAMPREVYTGLGEVAGVNLLTRFFANSSRDLTLIRSRLAKWQDLATGNSIFLSSARFRTLDTQMAHPVDFEFIERNYRTVIRNRNVQPGEPAEYLADVEAGTDGMDDGTDYALVSVWPGTMPGRRIVTMGGTYTWGTEGAAEFLTDGHSLNMLKSKLAAGMPPPGSDHGLQIVLKVDVKNNQVAQTTYLTHHWLDGRSEPERRAAK